MDTIKFHLILTFHLQVHYYTQIIKIMLTELQSNFGCCTQKNINNSQVIFSGHLYRLSNLRRNFKPFLQHQQHSTLIFELKTLLNYLFWPLPDILTIIWMAEPGDNANNCSFELPYFSQIFLFDSHYTF